MIKKIIKIFIISALIIFFSCLAFYKYYAKDNLHRIRLARLLLFNSFSEIQEKFSKNNCNDLSDLEKEQGFEALVTAYCRPQSSNYQSRQDFLCAVGLNCSCPNGRNTEKDCHSSTLSWSSCLEFNESITPYCHQTADQSAPESGQVAADWQCFPQGSRIKINNNEYEVTDKGSAITGKRFDVWVDDCQNTAQRTGIYNIKVILPN